MLAGLCHSCVLRVHQGHAWDPRHDLETRRGGLRAQRSMEKEEGGEAPSHIPSHKHLGTLASGSMQPTRQQWLGCCVGPFPPQDDTHGSYNEQGKLLIVWFRIDRARKQCSKQSDSLKRCSSRAYTTTLEHLIKTSKSPVRFFQTLCGYRLALFEQISYF